jgi:hypothetical protein
VDLSKRYASLVIGAASCIGTDEKAFCDETQSCSELKMKGFQNNAASLFATCMKFMHRAPDLLAQ